VADHDGDARVPLHLHLDAPLDDDVDPGVGRALRDDGLAGFIGAVLARLGDLPELLVGQALEHPDVADLPLGDGLVDLQSAHGGLRDGVYHGDPILCTGRA